MAGLTRSMRAALDLLAASPVEIRGRDVWRQTYRTPGGWTLPAQTVGALVKRGLVRLTGPYGQKVELTAAGRREAAATAKPLAA